MKMKKIFYSLMVLTMAFATVACSDDDENNNGGGNGGNGGGNKTEVLYSFTQKAYTLGQQTEITVELLNRKDASPIVAEENIPVALTLQDATTAVQGEDFEIVNPTAIVPKGSNKCTFTLKSIVKDETEEPAPTADEETAEEPKVIVLGLHFESDKFIAGAYPIATVTMIGSMVNELYGTWVMNELVTTPEVLNVNWGYDLFAVADGFPVFNAEDKFVFESGKLTTTLASDWKNYFMEESDFTLAGEYTLRLDMFTRAELQLIELKNVNRYFSAAEQSEDKVALIGVRTIEGEDGEELLDVYVIDYESHSFAKDLLDFGMYEPTKPSAAMTDVFLNFTLKKAVETAE